MHETIAATRIEHSCDLPGARMFTWETPGLDTFVPYFYSPALNPARSHMLLCGDRGDEEQLWLLDLERDELTRLTDAKGSGQHWAPYIRQQVRGIRPQFAVWEQPAFTHAIFWEDQTLCRVDATTGAVESLWTLASELVPAVPHCSANGWIGFGTSPRVMHDRLREGASVFELDAELERGCGFVVIDAATGEVAERAETPFWPNHVSASPDHRHILLCHEGDWKLQRMYLHEVATGALRPLREQSDGARIGHEFWLDARTVAYHGTTEAGGFFGIVDIESGERTEYPSPDPETVHYGHYHVSPDRTRILTDGEVTADAISIAPLGGSSLAFTPVCRHGWAREQDQRYHPHPHWHPDGRHITFTSCHREADGTVHRRISLLILP